MSGPETVTIRAIASGGDGVGTLADGRTVFVPRTAPGDAVTLGRVRRHARFARAEAERIGAPGPGRTEPPCPHYVHDQCGGCQLMHLDQAAQRAAKRTIVGDALRRIARFEVTDPDVVPAPAALGYRAKVTFAVDRGVVGLHRRGEAGTIFEVRRCLLLEPVLDDLHQRVRAARRHLPDDATHVVLRRDAHGGRHVVLRTAGRMAWAAAADFAAGLGDDVVTWWHPEGGAARAVAGSSDPWPATVFEQVNPAVAAAVRAHAVAELLGDQQRESPPLAWDLYAGIGEATAMLAARGATVESVELDPRAVALATRLGPDGPRRLVGDAGAVVGRLRPPRLVYANPPRAGMDERVTAALSDCGAERITYVSCDPATLARDLRRLDSRYRLVALAAFDQFPQTAHVECVATLESR